MRPPASTLSLMPYAAGSRLLAARSASRVRWELSIASDSTRRAPTRSLAIAANAPSNSFGPRASRSCSCTPNDRAATFTSLIASWWYALSGFERMATRRILGTVSLSSSSCLANSSRPALPDTPVTFPPGRARLAMSPLRANVNHNDGDRLGGVLGCRRCLRPRRCDDQVHLEPDQLGRQVGQPVDPTLRISIVDDNILALNPSELAQPLPERVEQGRPIGRGRQPKETYPRHLARLLLRTRRERPRSSCSTEQRDDLAPLHSITSSAATCRLTGTVS